MELEPVAAPLRKASSRTVIDLPVSTDIRELLGFLDQRGLCLDLEIT